MSSDMKLAASRTVVARDKDVLVGRAASAERGLGE